MISYLHLCDEYPVSLHPDSLETTEVYRVLSVHFEPSDARSREERDSEYRKSVARDVTARLS